MFSSGHKTGCVPHSNVETIARENKDIFCVRLAYILGQYTRKKLYNVFVRARCVMINLFSLTRK